MSIEPLTFFVISFAVANLVVMGAVLAVPSERRSTSQGATGEDERLPTRFLAAGSPELDRTRADASPATYDRILRVLWWLTIAAVLIGVGLSGAYAETGPLIFAGGAFAVAFTFLVHEIAPERWIAPWKFAVEGIVATGLVTGLLLLTGYGSSPYFFGYYLIAVGVALTLGRRATLLFAGISGLVYVGVLVLDPNSSAFAAGDLLRFGLNIGSVWLLAYLAAVFAAEERRARAAVVRMSVTDPLTGLFNRVHLYATLEQEIRRTRRSERGFCLLMMDLDGLKAVNDSLGHHRGDEVLRALAGVIGRSIRTVDTAARYGGDEFVVLLPETDRSGAYVVAEKIRAGAEELTYGMQHEPLPTSVSIGLVYHPEDGATADELMIAADRAMYTSKSLGKNQISGVPDRRSVGRLPVLARSTDTRAPLTRGGSIAVPVNTDEEPAVADEAVAASPTPIQNVEPVVEPANAATVAAGETAGSVADQPPAAAAAPATTHDPEPSAGAPETRAAETPAAETPATATPPAEIREPAPAAVGPVPESSGGNGANYDEADDDLDPAEARRRIAKLSYDPDHQVRRAMDAFLSAPGRTKDEGP